MTEGLRALLTEIIDYAGMFPPAQLAFDPAIENYLRYHAHADAWMLGRFICPAAKLGEFARFDERLRAQATPIRVSALGRGGDSVEAFIGNLRHDVADICATLERRAGRIRIDAFEARLPPDCVQGGAPAIADACRRAVELLARAPGLAAIALESPSVGPPSVQLPAVIAGIASASKGAASRVGFKLRCGGTDASAFPDAATIARVLRAGVDHRVALKFTAGLHHPLPRWDEGVRARMHGFVNVFVAGLLACVYELSESDLVEILQAERPEQFAITSEYVGFGDSTVPCDEIAALRAGAITSFGSCSFDEPRQDLRSLGWLG
ncbi:MAG: hypothetical protein U1D55_11545 [Phycisphaerae bacterium]